MAENYAIFLDEASEGSAIADELLKLFVGVRFDDDVPSFGRMVVVFFGVSPNLGDQQLVEFRHLKNGPSCLGPPYWLFKQQRG